MALTKSGKTSLFAIASVTSNTASIGSAVSVASYYSAIVRIRMGRGTGTAFTTAPRIRIEGSAVASSPTKDEWFTMAEFVPLVGANIGSQALGGTEAVGQTTITLAAGTNFAAGNYVFFQHTTIANSEWARVLSVSGADIVIEEGLVNEQTAAASVCRNQAEIYQANLDLVGVNNLRLYCDGYGTGQAFVVQADFGAVSAL